MVRRFALLAASASLVALAAGCEVTASAYVQKDWRTDARLYATNDLVTKAEIKVTRLVGRDARVADRRKAADKPDS